MTKLLNTLFVSALVLPGLAFSATIGQIDSFQNGTNNNWFAGGLGMGQVPPTPPHVVANGGPLGAGDEFLLVTADQATGAGSRLAVINLSQWTGNYLTSGIAGITMDLKNFGSTALSLRLLIADPMNAPPVDEVVSTASVLLPVGSGWMRSFFPIAPSAFTVVSGSVTLALSQATEFRIIDSPTPTDAIQMMGSFGVDNISAAAATPEPSGAGLLGLGLLAIGVVSFRNRHTTRLRRGIL